MVCTECKGKGEEQYGDERLTCIACHGCGEVSQASIFGTNREFGPRTDPWEWGGGDSRDD